MSLTTDGRFDGCASRTSDTCIAVYVARMVSFTLMNGMCFLFKGIGVTVIVAMLNLSWSRYNVVKVPFHDHDLCRETASSQHISPRQ